MSGKILIGGGGYADIPMILSAKKMGLTVYTTGNRPDEMGHRYSDEYIPADFSDREAILKICRSLKVDAVCPCCNDFSAMSAAYAASALGLPGHDRPETLETLMHKDKFRAFASEHGLPVPGWRAVTRHQPVPANLGLRYPLIVKPVDLTGGKGISRVDRPAELQAALALAAERTRQETLVVEEFLRPDTFHHNFVAFLSRGRVVFYNSDNEHYYKNPYLVWGMSVPSAEPRAVDARLAEYCEKAAALLHLKDGLVLMQHCVQNGELFITEFSRRMPGNLHGRLIELATGFTLTDYTIMAALGGDCGGAVQKEPQGFWAENCVMHDRNGVLESLAFDPAIRDNIAEDMIWAGPGFAINDYMVDKLGILLLRFSSFEDMIAKSETMCDYMHITLR
jgi:biotin carboxylase